MVGDRYLIQLGKDTRTEMSGVLLLWIFVNNFPEELEDFALDLATVAKSVILSETLPYPHQNRFLNAHYSRLEAETRKEYLSSPHMKEILSGAAYNISYGRYVAAGGGRIMNRFLGYLRSENLVPASNPSASDNLRDQLDRRSRDILRPIDSLKFLGLWKPRPENPNERTHFLNIKALGKRVLEDLDRLPPNEFREKFKSNKSW